MGQDLFLSCFGCWRFGADVVLFHLLMCVCLQSDAGDVCYCCAVSPTSKCPEEKLLELHPAHSCSTMRTLLKVPRWELLTLHSELANITSTGMTDRYQTPPHMWAHADVCLVTVCVFCIIWIKVNTVWNVTSLSRDAATTWPLIYSWCPVAFKRL